jgi:hypothetical protein
MRRLHYGLLVVFIATLLAQGFSAGPATGLPLFSRKYQVACANCHLAVPRLNSFGIAFKQNGYRMPDSKGESPADVKEFPLSVLGNVGAHYEHQTRPGAVSSAFAQNASELHSAGTLAEQVSFRFDAGFDGIGGPLASGEAFVQFDDCAKGGALNVKAGIYDADIPYLADSRSTTLAGYLTPVTLDGQGFEVNGTKNGWTYAAGLGNSGRTAGKPRDTSINHLENSYVWLMRDVKDQLVCARVFLDRQDPRDTTKTAASHVGVQGSVYLNKARWALVPGFTYESFADANASQRDKVMTGLLEGLMFLDKNSRWLLTARYELRHAPKFDFEGATAFAEQDNHQEVANLAFYATPNARLALEWAHAADNAGGPRLDTIDAFVNIAY